MRGTDARYSHNLSNDPFSGSRYVKPDTRAFVYMISRYLPSPINHFTRQSRSGFNKTPICIHLKGMNDIMRRIMQTMGNIGIIMSVKFRLNSFLRNLKKIFKRYF